MYKSRVVLVNGRTGVRVLDASVNESVPEITEGRARVLISQTHGLALTYGKQTTVIPRDTLERCILCTSVIGEE